MLRNPPERKARNRCVAILRSCDASFRSATPTNARRPPGLRTSVALTKFPNSEQAPLWKLRQAERNVSGNGTTPHNHRQTPDQTTRPRQKKIKKPTAQEKIFSQRIWHIWFFPTHNPTRKKPKEPSHSKPTHHPDFLLHSKICQCFE